MAEFSLALDLRKRADSALQKAKNLVITSHQEQSMADRAVSEAVSIKKGIQKYWAPMKEMAKKNLDLQRNKEREMLEPLEETQQVLIEKMAEWKSQEEERYLESVERKKEEHKNEAIEAAFQMAEEGLPKDQVRAMQELANDTSSVQVAHYEVKTRNTIKTSWELTISEDAVEAGKIPKEYLIPINETMRKAVAANIKTTVIAKGGNIEIPGVIINKVTKSIKRGAR